MGKRRLSISIQENGSSAVGFEDDITNISFVSGKPLLVYAAGPLYGVPGVFLVNLRTGARSKVVAARNTGDPAYPKGTDFIIICDATTLGADQLVIRLYRYQDVERDSVWARPPTVPIESDTVRLPRL